jgi:hypothetical protein
MTTDDWEGVLMARVTAHARAIYREEMAVAKSPLDS